MRNPYEYEPEEEPRVCATCARFFEFDQSVQRAGNRGEGHEGTVRHRAGRFGNRYRTGQDLRLHRMGERPDFGSQRPVRSQAGKEEGRMTKDSQTSPYRIRALHPSHTARACSGVCPCTGACPEGCHPWLANGDACRAVRAVWLDVVRCGLGKQGDTPTRRPKEQGGACQGYSNQAIPRGGIEGMARGR